MTPPQRSQLFLSDPVVEAGQDSVVADQLSSAVSVSSGGRFDVNGDHIVGQARQQPAFTSDDLPHLMAHRSGPRKSVGVRLFDAGLPEPEAIGQSLSVAWAGEQFEEKVGVVGRQKPATPWAGS